MTAEKKAKRKLISFDPPPDVRDLLMRAQAATGATISDLVIEAVRSDLETIVRKLVAERRRAEDEFFKTADGPAQTKKKAAS